MKALVWHPFAPDQQHDLSATSPKQVRLQKLPSPVSTRPCRALQPDPTHAQLLAHLDKALGKIFCFTAALYCFSSSGLPSCRRA